MPSELERIQLCGGRCAIAFPIELQAKYVKDFTATTTQMYRIQPGGVVVPEGVRDNDKDIYNFKFRPSDVLVMSYLKCGSTWTQEIIWNMINNPNLDHPDPEEPLMSRSPVIGADMATADALKDSSLDKILDDPMFTHFKLRCPDMNNRRGIHIQVAESYEKPRVLKTHLPFSCFKPGILDVCKVVLCVRHPKDVVLSYQHHCRLLKSHGFVGTQDVFVKYFVDDLLLFGSYGNLLREALPHQDHPNMYVTYFEDMKEDPQGAFRRLDKFLGTKLTDTQLKNVAKQTSFENMQKFDPYKMMASGISNKDVAKKDGPFIRQGKAGAFKGVLTAEQDKLIDKYMKDNFIDEKIKERYMKDQEVAK